MLKLLEEIRAIAHLGLNYSNDVYDRERYERLLDLASSEYACLSDLPPQVISDRFRAELGYITPNPLLSLCERDPYGERITAIS